MIFLKTLIYIGNILLIFNTILYLRALHNSKAFKIFTLFLVVISIIQTSMTLISRLLHENNLYLNNVFLIIQFVVLSIFYKTLLKRKIVVYVLIAVMIFLGYQYSNDLELFYVYNPIGISVTQTILMIYSLVYLYDTLRERQPQFLLVNIGVFLYLICSTLIFVSGNLIFNINIPQETYLLLLKLNAILFIIFQILIFIEWRKNYYKKIHRS